MCAAAPALGAASGGPSAAVPTPRAHGAVPPSSPTSPPLRPAGLRGGGDGASSGDGERDGERDGGSTGLGQQQPRARQGKWLRCARRDSAAAWTPHPPAAGPGTVSASSPAPGSVSDPGSVPVADGGRWRCREPRWGRRSALLSLAGQGGSRGGGGTDVTAVGDGTAGPAPADAAWNPRPTTGEGPSGALRLPRGGSTSQMCRSVFCSAERFPLN